MSFLIFISHSGAISFRKAPSSGKHYAVFSAKVHTVRRCHVLLQVVVLDARTFEERARVTYRAEGTVTEGFHGVFVQDGQGFLGH